MDLATVSYADSRQVWHFTCFPGRYEYSSQCFISPSMKVIATKHSLISVNYELNLLHLLWVLTCCTKIRTVYLSIEKQPFFHQVTTTQSFCKTALFLYSFSRSVFGCIFRPDLQINSWSQWAKSLHRDSFAFELWFTGQKAAIITFATVNQITKRLSVNAQWISRRKYLLCL